MIQKIAENVITLLTVALIALTFMKARNWLYYRQLRQGMPALMPGMYSPGMGRVCRPSPDPRMVAHQEKMMREMLDGERDARYLRFKRLSHLWPGEKDTGATTEQLEAEAALERALKTPSMAELYRTEHPNAPGSSDDIYGEAAYYTGK